MDAQGAAPGALGQAIVTTVEERFLERGFLATPPWALAREGLLALDTSGPAGEVQAAAQALLDVLPTSHVALLTPDQVADAAARQGGDVPAHLRLSAQQGPGWTYLRVPSFTLPAFTAGEFRELAGRAGADDVLVLDLRLNAGGALSCTGEALGALLGPGVRYARTDLGETAAPRRVTPVPETENAGHTGDVAAVESGPTEWFTAAEVPLRLRQRTVVLTGPRCYSCGEVFAQAVQEHGRALLVGAATAGAVIAGRDHELPGGWRLILPFAHLRSGAGADLEGAGARPDLQVDLPETDLEPLPAARIETIVSLARRGAQGRE